MNAVYRIADVLSCGDDDGECQQNDGGDTPVKIFVMSSVNVIPPPYQWSLKTELSM